MRASSIAYGGLHEPGSTRVSSDVSPNRPDAEPNAKDVAPLEELVRRAAQPVHTIVRDIVR